MPMANFIDEGSPYISTAVAIDRDKNSQQAVKWAVENLNLKDDRIVLVHVSTQLNQNSSNETRSPTAAEMNKLYLPYRGYCARKGIRAKEVILHDLDVASALCEYIRASSFTTIVLGASSRSALARAFKNTDVPTTVGALAPNFCSVYVVSKGKTTKIKTASGSPKFKASLSTDNNPSARFHNQGSGRNSPPDVWDSNRSSPPFNAASNIRDKEYYFGLTERTLGSNSPSPHGSADSNDFMQMLQWENRKIPIPESTKANYESLGYASNFNSPQDSGFGDMIMRNRHPDTKMLTLSQSVNNLINLSISSASGSSDNSGEQSFRSDVSFEPLDVSRTSESPRSSASSQTTDIEDELRRLKLELKQITELYNVACREAVTAREEVKGIVQWKSEEGNKLEEALHAQEAALAIVERDRKSVV